MSDIIHIDMDNPGEPSDKDPHLVLTIGQPVVVCFHREDVYLAGEIIGLDMVGLLVKCFWKTENGIQHTQDSYVPWTAIESVDLYGSIKSAVKAAWALLAPE